MKNVAKKKMGRPYIEGTEPKSVMLRIRVSEEDLKNLDKKCKKLNKSRSEVLRDYMNSE